MSDTVKRPRGKSEKQQQKEREEKFFSLIDRAQELVEAEMRNEHDIKDLKQITGALKDLKDLIFDKADRSTEKEKNMVIKIEGDVE